MILSRGRLLSLAGWNNCQHSGKRADHETTGHSNLTTTISKELTLRDSISTFTFLLGLAEFGGVVQLDLSAGSLLR